MFLLPRLHGGQPSCVITWRTLRGGPLTAFLAVVSAAVLTKEFLAKISITLEKINAVASRKTKESYKDRGVDYILPGYGMLSKK